eukprot:c28850_g1_i1 orf=396-3701(+)
MEALPSSRRLATDAHARSLRNLEYSGILSTPGIEKSSSQSVSERKHSADTDSELYNAGQSLASILNNPHLGKSGVYGSDLSWGAWFFSLSNDNVDVSLPVPLKLLPEVTRADFQPYIDSISEAYGRFSDVREHSNWEQSNQASTAGVHRDVEGEASSQGGGLAACLREIPSLYFNEGFALEDGSTFRAACPYSSIPQSMMLQEKLSHYLDIVEVHLVKEISARSDSFFEAQGQLEDLNSNIIQACGLIRDLKLKVQISDVDVVESARCIQSLSQQRDNLLGLHKKLKLMSYVKQALNALDLLVNAADCGGALDVIDDLQHLLESEELVGLHCFRHLGDRLASSMNSINSMLAADFVSAAIHDNKDLKPSVGLSKFRKHEFDLITVAGEDKDVEGKDNEEDEISLHEQLLPLVIGLLRTSKLPAVLRVYRDTLITDIRAAIKAVVADVLPVLFTRPLDNDLQTSDRQGDMEVGGVSLASKLRSLPAESFVRLLTAVFETVQVRLIHAAEVRRVIENIIGGLHGSYAAAAVAAAFASGAAAAAAAEAAQEDQLQPLHVVPAQKVPPQYGYSFVREIETPSPTTMSRNFRADVLRENTEAVCAACDAAHDRWAKLLSVRALIHPKLRLQEFVNIFNITQDFMSATKKVGGRYASSIQIPLQAQSKAFVDFQHSSRMSKITAVLEQETWVAVDAPDEFQAIVNCFAFTESSSNDILETDQLMVSSYNERLNNLESEISNDQISEDASTTERSNSPLKQISNQNSDESSDAGIGRMVERQGPPVADGTGKPDSAVQNISTVVNGLEHGPTVQSEDVVTIDTAGRSKRVREKPIVKTLHIQGTRYHMVNSGLILLKMLSEYMDISTALPTLASEVVHRIAEILKLFNSRTCQLVLGAGAMQVSGLKSITAKHLALASQCISFFYALIPDMRRILSIHIPDVRKSLLLTEIDRVTQDYKIHKDEIHSKLVQIMKERLMAHLRTLPQLVELWNKSDDQDMQPSHFARALTKEVGVLHRVLSPLLLDADIRYIFTLVVGLFHSQLADSFSKLEVNTPAAKHRLYGDIQHILACTRGLPSDALNSDGTQKPGELDVFLQQRYGTDVLSETA